MKSPKIVAALFAIAFVAASCSKEKSFSANGSNGSGTGSIQGNWKFISTSGITSTSTVENNSGIESKAEIILRYASSNPVGVYNISGTIFKGVGVGYDYNGKLILRQLENNVVQFEDSSDISMPMPPSNSESKYKLIGTDSIYFETGALSGPSAPGSTAPAVTGVGCKYKLEGNRLTFIMKTSIPQVITQNGITLKVTQSTDVNIVLEKQ
ncbi:hypothetical protein ESA94_13920 [Lacibacter luteus]|uniref:Lipocalin-like domain-containing protein n=1 Tax=Lacibacter luteus TaxID=2508719 RepID=A0A4V1M7C2_9BACT|nr:hypothetical protein [Lacibacter luteus]RXK59234.1 hypothetical protein ESA94_13920 [Lacibacter luteus]